MANVHRAALIVATLLSLSPVIASAQGANADLRNTIQSSILSDPRSVGIPPSQLQELIDALVQEAQAKGMTSADIVTRPQQAAAGSTFGNVQTQNEVCATGWQEYLCQFNHVFGFEGGNYVVPVFLLVVTAFLIAVVWELIVHHRKVLARKANPTPTPIQ